MSDHSNLEAFADSLAKVADCLDLRRGAGKEALAYVANKIHERSQAEQGSDGDWAANAPKYAKRKAKFGLPVGVGLPRKGNKTHMLNNTDIMGTQTIEADSATMTFGTSEEISKRGQWFTAGSVGTDNAEPSGASNQPPRPFYEMTEADADAVTDMLIESAGNWIEG